MCNFRRDVSGCTQASRNVLERGKNAESGEVKAMKGRWGKGETNGKTASQVRLVILKIFFAKHAHKSSKAMLKTSIPIF